jgi:hypothetical protein
MTPNLCQNSFMRFTLGPNTIKLLTAKIYAVVTKVSMLVEGAKMKMTIGKTLE